MDLHDIIWTDPRRVGGAACFRGTRIPVQLLMEYLDAGRSVDEFLRQYPDLSPERVRAYLRLAHERLLAGVGAA